MIKIVLLTLVAIVKAQDTSDIFVGEFECHLYDGTTLKNDWHYVTITFDSGANVYKWTNRAGVVWTLYPKDNKTLRVGKDCPYYKNGHVIARFIEDGVYGPWDEFYKRKSNFRAPPWRVHNQIVAYWGQNASGGKGLLPENDLKFYCDNFDYDVIPISFLNNFLDANNKDQLPGITLSNHCNETFSGNPDLLKCLSIGEEIRGCQARGKKITIALGGSAVHRTFQNVMEADAFASTVWNLFLGGMSDVRPFGDVTLDGIVLDINGPNLLYYKAFVNKMRKLMSADRNHEYTISASLDSNFSVVMHDAEPGHILKVIPHEFDQLYLNSFTNFIDNRTHLDGLIDFWYNFAEETRETHGKGPYLIVGLLAHLQKQNESNYDVLREVLQRLVFNRYFRGVALWDASFDSSSTLNGKYYSSYISDIMRFEPEIIICPGFGPFIKSLRPGVIAGIVLIILVVGLAILKVVHMKCRGNKVQNVEGKLKIVEVLKPNVIS